MNPRKIYSRARISRGIGRRRRAIPTSFAALAAAALLLTACAGPGYDAGESLRIAGGVKAGVYYSYGEQLAGRLHEQLGMDVEVSETEGSVDNLRRVAHGEAAIGFAQGDTAADAISGTGAFDTPLQIDAIARVYDEYVQVVVPAGSSAHSLADLAGHRVSLGAEGSGVQVIATKLLTASGIAPADIDNPALGLDASIKAMREGKLDGFFWVGGLPTPSIESLAGTRALRLIAIDAKTLDQMNAEQAVYRLAEIPPGTYGADDTTETLTVPNYLITSASADEDLIADITRTLFASRESIMQSVPAAAFLDRRQAIFTTPLDLHPGAEKYYRDSRR